MEASVYPILLRNVYIHPIPENMHNLFIPVEKIQHRSISKFYLKLRFVSVYISGPLQQ